MFDPRLPGPGGDLAAGGLGLLADEPSAEEVAFVAALDAAERSAWNAPPAPVEPSAVAEALAGRARTAEALTRKAQAVMLREVHALTAQVVAEDAAYYQGIRKESLEFAADEVAAALGVARRTADARIEDAAALVQGCPRVLACLEAGLIAYPVAAAIAREVALAPGPLQAEVQARVLDALGGPDLPGLGRLTVEQITQTALLEQQACWRVGLRATRATMVRLVRQVITDLGAQAVEADPSPAGVDVEAYPTRPGTMMFGAELSEADGTTAMARLHGLARLLKARPGETRSMGELRWQAYRDLVVGHTPPPPAGADCDSDLTDHRSDRRRGGPTRLGWLGQAAPTPNPSPDSSTGPRSGVGPDRSPTPGRAVAIPGDYPAPVPFDVHLTVDAAGRAATPRYGPLAAGALEAILDASAASGGRVHVKQISPRPCPGDHPEPEALAADPDPRYPAPSLAAAVRMRDRTCRFPGCTIPAGRCDLDHTLPWPHGPTCECNTSCLCRHHHRLKTHGRWQLTNHGGGHLTWTTPTGRTIDSWPDP